MSRPYCAFLWCLVAVSGSAQSTHAATFSGQRALEYTAKAVSFGPRPAGSPALVLLRTYIRRQLTASGWQVTADAFTAQTPDGPVQMENIVARLPGKSGHSVAITGHYDTKKMPGFVGANDGGSSTGFLLELAAALRNRSRTDDLYLVFFDGEEAVRDWSDTDSVYGSRHLAARWAADGTVGKLKALLNIDMIGDKNLRLVYETGSAPSLLKLVWDIGDSLGYSASFPRQGGPVSDDHMPFINAGVRALDLIDFDSQSTFWHTPRDTMDKLSAHSFDIVGQVVLKTIETLEQQK